MGLSNASAHELIFVGNLLMKTLEKIHSCNRSANKIPLSQQPIVLTGVVLIYGIVQYSITFVL